MIDLLIYFIFQYSLISKLYFFVKLTKIKGIKNHYIIFRYITNILLIYYS